MAHAGKFYPVAFRRDFSTGLTSYRRAMGRAMYLFDLNSTGTIGGSIGTDNLVFTEFEPRTRHIARWECPPSFLNGRIVSGYLECTEVNNQGRMQWKAEMFDQIQGSLVKGVGETSASFGYQSLAGQWDQNYKPHPTLWTPGPGFINFNALTWAQIGP